MVKRTVRCCGVSLSSEVDGGTHGDEGSELDVVALLTTHFPQHGPYLGVYAQVVSGGWINIGDRVNSIRPRPPPWWALAVRDMLHRAGVRESLVSCADPTVGVLCAGFLVLALSMHGIGLLSSRLW